LCIQRYEFESTLFSALSAPVLLLLLLLLLLRRRRLQGSACCCHCCQPSPAARIGSRLEVHG
jgi:LPXTG-motif cell wall-anchored protein